MTKKWTELIRTYSSVWKIPLAAALSWELAEWVGSRHPYLSPITVILTMQASVSQSMTFAWQRALGTIAGVLFTAVAAPYVGISGWSLALLLFIWAAVAAWLKWDHVLFTQIALSVMLVLFFQVKSPSFPLDRIRDTLIGAVVGILFQLLIFPPDSVAQAQKKTTRFADRLTNLFFMAAQWIERGCSSAEAQTIKSEMQFSFRELHRTTTELETASQSLKYNPLARKKSQTLNRLNGQMDRLRLGYANLSDMIRIVTKWSDTGHFTKEDQRIWADHFQRIGSLVQAYSGLPRDPALAASDPAAPTIQAPPDIGMHQYPLALYANAEQIVQDFRIPAPADKASAGPSP